MRAYFHTFADREATLHSSLFPPPACERIVRYGIVKSQAISAIMSAIKLVGRERRAVFHARDMTLNANGGSSTSAQTSRRVQTSESSLAQTLSQISRILE